MATYKLILIRDNNLEISRMFTDEMIEYFSVDKLADDVKDMYRQLSDKNERF
jgi:hypothetical protein